MVEFRAWLIFQGDIIAIFAEFNQLLDVIFIHGWMLAVWELEIWSQCNFEFRPLLIELMMYQGGCKMIGVARSSQKISSAPPYPFTKLINTMQNLGSQSISFKLGQGTFVQLICRNNYVYILFIFFIYLFQAICWGELRAILGNFAAFADFSWCCAFQS